jgi:hypothetical protein
VKYLAGWLTTVIIGRSTSGKFWTLAVLNANSPATVSITNSKIAGTGLRIDQAEKFMVATFSESIE